MQGQEPKALAGAGFDQGAGEQFFEQLLLAVTALFLKLEQAVDVFIFSLAAQVQVPLFQFGQHQAKMPPFLRHDRCYLLYQLPPLRELLDQGDAGSGRLLLTVGVVGQDLFQVHFRQIYPARIGRKLKAQFGGGHTQLDFQRNYEKSSREKRASLNIGSRGIHPLIAMDRHDSLSCPPKRSGMPSFSFKIGFLPITLLDVLDILIVGYLIYQIYKLLKGTIAFNIFIGVLTMFVLWWLVGRLGMDLLFAVLDQFVSVGIILIIVIFQPEIRRYLLFLGNTTLKQRSTFLGRMLDRNLERRDDRAQQVGILQKALVFLANRKTGALVVLATEGSLRGIISAGIPVDARLTEQMLISIFQKSSPLHDGAVVIADGRIQVASAILPVSENERLPTRIGLRHRAAVGITEKADVSTFVVSEETGKISFARNGRLIMRLNEEQVGDLLRQHLK